MILNQAPKQNVISSCVSSQKLRISSDELDQAILVDLQISKLYRNKIRAVVQEYISNARDANVEAGKKDCQISIHVPKPSEPWFSVSDVGLGMSPEIVDKYLCQTGASSKRNTNDSIGSFGLGAKCGFAYIKERKTQFNITTVSDGIKHFYICHYDEFGFPNVSLLSSEPSNDIGTEVKIPVDNGDVGSFTHELQRILSFWVDKYPFETSSNIDLKIPEVFYDCDGYTIYKGRFGFQSNYGNDFISIAGIPYDRCSTFDSFTIVGKMPIGVLDIVPSREFLEETKNNDEHINPIFDSAKKYIIEHFQKLVDGMKNELEVWLAFQSKKIPNELCKHLKYKNEPIDFGSICKRLPGFYSSQIDFASEIKFIHNNSCLRFENDQRYRIRSILNTNNYIVYYDADELKGWRKNQNYFETWNSFSKNLREQILQKAIVYSTLKTPRAKRDKTDKPSCWKLESERWVAQFEDISTISGTWFVGANLKPVDEKVMKIFSKVKADWSSQIVSGDIYMIPKRNVKLAEANKDLRDIFEVAKENILKEESIKKIYSFYIKTTFGDSAIHLWRNPGEIKDEVLKEVLNKGLIKDHGWRQDFQHGSNHEFYAKLFGKKFMTPDIEHVLEKYDICSRFTNAHENNMMELVKFVGDRK